jgi:two-component system chemotaxis sensor kinase CheA
VGEGKYLYAVRLDWNRDILEPGREVSQVLSDLSSTGELLFSDLDASGKDVAGSGEEVCLVVATILDTEFLAEVLEVSQDQILRIDLSPMAQSGPGEGSGAAPCGDPPECMPACDRQGGTPSVDGHGDVRPEPENDPGNGDPEVPAAGVNGVAPEALNREGGAARQARKTAETIRVSVDLISRLMNLAGELVLGRNQLRPLIEAHAGEDPAVTGIMQNLNLVTTEIQEDIMQLRMQPVSTLLGRFNRMVRDLAKALSKSAELVIHGAEVELDKTVLEGLANPFTHLIRNCVDHGLETPEERRSAGKPETGTIVIRAYHQSGNVHIVIEDDGRGMHPDRILEKALERGILTQAQAEGMTDREKINLIFVPGFSTSEKVTDISGRGVGMDVVKTNIGQLRGVIDVESVPGGGTKVMIIIPLTLAIVSALIVGTGGFRFAIPQVNVSEVVFLKPGDLRSSVETVSRSEVMRFRGSLLPVVRLRTLLDMEILIEDPETGLPQPERRNSIADRRARRKNPEERELRTRSGDRRRSVWDAVYVVVLKVGNNRFGLCVEELHDMEEIVVKPLSWFIRDCRCFSGATILGDGKVIMILDAPGIADYAGLRFDAVNAEVQRRRTGEGDGGLPEESGVRNVIVFSSAPDEFFALPLERMARLEAVGPEAIHRIGGKRFMNHNGASLSLLGLEELLPVSPCGGDGKDLHVIIPRGMTQPLGLVVGRIIDTLTFSGALARDSGCPVGVEGKVFIDGRLVQFLDLDRLLPLIAKEMERSA